MTPPAQRYIFRFIHIRGPGGWSVQDTQSGRTFGCFASEDEAVAVALTETHRHSAYRSEASMGLEIPLA